MVCDHANISIISKFLFKGIYLTVITFMAGCGVEAGNPDSTQKKPNSFLNIQLTDAPIDEINKFMVYVDRIEFASGVSTYSVSLNQEEAIDIMEFRNGKVLNILENYQISRGTFDRFTLFLKDKPIEVYKDNSDTALNAAIIQDGKTTNHLEFLGRVIVADDDTETILIDVDLRQTLTKMTDQQRSNNNLSETYIYALQRDHKFSSTEHIGSVSVAGLKPGQLICVIPSTIIGDDLPDDCIQEDINTGYADENGDLFVPFLKPNKYHIWLLNNGSFDAVATDILIDAGKTSTISID